MVTSSALEKVFSVIPYCENFKEELLDGFLWTLFGKFCDFEANQNITLHFIDL
jgi:hypothetical protein